MSDQHICRGDALTASQLHDILRLRVDVFVVEQACAYAEVDGLDLLADTEHVWLDDGDGVVAYLRVLGIGAADGPVRIGRVVTRADRRGESLGQRLFVSVLDRLGRIETRLEAQSHLAGWYERLGYRTDGDEYVEDGIPHLPMVRPIPSSERKAVQ